MSTSKPMGRHFFDHVTIHGVSQVFGHTTKRKICRLSWLTLFLFMTLLISWQTTIAVKLYLDYSIDTSITETKSTSTLVFPAITICVRTALRRSVVGGQNKFLAMVTGVFSASTSHLEKSISENIKYCIPQANAHPMTDLNDNLPVLANEHGFDGMMKIVSLTSKECLIKCQFRNKIIDCGSITVNHFTDDGMCFTINPSFSETDILKKIFGYSVQMTQEENVLTTSNSGPGNGIQLLLNVNQDDYCGNFRESGSGFNAFIHDQSEVGSVHDKARLFMRAGYSYNVALQPVVYERKTERLGLCKTKITYPKVHFEADYSLSACKLLCQLQFIWDQCSCLMLSMINNTDTINKVLNIEANEDTFCKINKLICQNGHLDYFNKFSEKLCPHCLPQCSQTKYEYYLTSSKLNSNTFQKQFGIYNMNETNYARNYLIFNVYFGSMNGQIITEYQAYSILDLFITISNGLGLFLGMSVLSLFEPLYFTIEKIKLLLARKLCSNKIFIRRQNKCDNAKTESQNIAMVDLEIEPVCTSQETMYVDDKIL